MNQIILDSLIPPITNSRTVNLCILKKDMDRRFDKIRSLLGWSQANSNMSMKKQLVSVACQTGEKQNNQSNTQKAKHRRAFSQQQNISLKQSVDHDNSRSSLASTLNKKRQQRNEPLEANDHNVRIRVSDYLSSEKKQICRRSCLKQTQPLMNESEDEIQKIKFQNSQDDKIFKSIEFQLHSSFKSIGSFQQVEPSLCAYIISEGVSGEPSQSECTNSQQEERRSFWAINQKQASMKKIRYTDRTSLPQTKRIIVTEQCVSRLTQSVSLQVGKNRKQPSDCKLRANLIKKIEEKYGEYYENS